MIKPILQIGDKRLNQRSDEIEQSELKDTKFVSLLADMLDTASQPGLNSVGLSAVQIGELKRVFVCKRIDQATDPDKAEWLIAVNPKVTIIDDTETEMWEGCLSVGENGGQLFAPVRRARSVKLNYLDKEGIPQELIASDYFAHVVQHEVDHLDGLLFLKYVRNLRNIWRSDALDKYLDKYGDYPAVAD